MRYVCVLEPSPQAHSSSIFLAAYLTFGPTFSLLGSKVKYAAKTMELERLGRGYVSCAIGVLQYCMAHHSDVH